MSRYNTIIPNDVANGEGVCVSFFVQGCPHHCEGCFNPETWDFDGGEPYTPDLKWELIKLISANDIRRNFSVLGGEPLAARNLDMVEEIVSAIRVAYPTIKIFLWTGYRLFDILHDEDERLRSILSKVDYIIDGRFEESQKDLNLKLRGSKNQKIWQRHNNEWTEVIDENEPYNQF